MAKSNYVKKAQKNIYVTGKRRTYTSEKGKRKDQEVSVLDRTIPADENDKILIAVGEPYYWWQFKNGGKNFSKTRPKASQLTQSAYLSTIYDIADELGEIRAQVSDPDDLSSAIDDIKSRLEELRDEQEEKKSNMPEGLQEGPTGELLQERYDNLDNAISELDGLDLDYDEPDEDDLREELKDNVDPSVLDSPEEGDEGFDEYDEDEDRKSKVSDFMIEERKDELLGEWLDEKCDEISNISLE